MSNVFASFFFYLITPTHSVNKVFLCWCDLNDRGRD